jgi:hypothetical protein
MQVELSDKEREIIECWFREWSDSEDMRMYGGISYQMCMDLAKKLNIEVPEDFQALMGAETDEEVEEWMKGHYA